MKKRLKTYAALCLASMLAFPIQVYATDSMAQILSDSRQTDTDIQTLTVQAGSSSVTLSGTCANTVVAIIAQIRDSNGQIISMESYPAANGQYRATISVALAAGHYTAYVADYNGGEWKTSEFQIQQTSGTTGDSSTSSGGSQSGSSSGGSWGGSNSSSSGSSTSGSTTTDTKTEDTKPAGTKPDGTKVETSTETKADGTKVDTTVETKTDGTKTETVVETAKDGSVKTTETVTNADGSATKTEKEKETNAQGKEVAVTTTTEKDASGKVTGITQTSEIDHISGSASATVTVEKTADGKITSAEAEVDKKGANSKQGVSATLFGSVVSQITEAAGTKSVEISMTVTAGKKEYIVKADAQDLEAGNKLKVMAIDEKTGDYVLVNAKTYTVNKSGSVKVVLPEGATYQLMDTKEAAAIEKKILNTVKVKKTAVTVEKGKKTAIQLNSKLDIENVEKITYSTSKKSVATVNKNGTVTTKQTGKVTIQAKVLLKNGKTKTVKMTVTVKA